MKFTKYKKIYNLGFVGLLVEAMFSWIIKIGKLPAKTDENIYFQFPATTAIIFSTHFFLIIFVPLAYDMKQTLVMTCDTTSLNTVLKACLTCHNVLRAGATQ